MNRTRLITLTLLAAMLVLLGACDLLNGVLGIPNPAKVLPDNTEIDDEYVLGDTGYDGWDLSADDLGIPATADKWYKITVPVHGSTISSTIWGSNPYTGDSRMAYAAVHAGAIDMDGGVFYIKTGGPDSGFYASTANDVTTNEYGDYSSSYVVYKAP